MTLPPEFGGDKESLMAPGDHFCFSATPFGRKRHGGGEYLPRHCHREPFAAIVLSGTYTEAGDRGRVRVGAGDVVLHGRYESHLDCFAVNGAEVLVLPYSDAGTHGAIARIEDPDVVARMAERDLSQAAQYVAAHLRPAAAVVEDWPDRLARQLRADPDLVIHEWAEEVGLSAESVSRGFRRIYGVPPVTFRARMRALRALALLDCSRPLADIAASCGFADQAHLSRSIRQLTGYSPKAWRALAHRSLNFCRRSNASIEVCGRCTATRSVCPAADQLIDT
jgi:AraC-like DNA-binding protein